MNILLTGGTGKLGTELQKLRDYIAPAHYEMDLQDEASVRSYLAQRDLDLIVHAGGYVNSLLPENDPIEALKCFEANVLGARYLVKYAKCPIIYISTEGVIDPYNVYCISKLAAENEIKKHKMPYLILRTNFWVNPYPYPKACDDLWTVGDSIEVIAKLINDLFTSTDKDLPNRTMLFGTAPKLVIDVARKSNPDIEAASCKEFGIPNRKELIKLWDK